MGKVLKETTKPSFSGFICLKWKLKFKCENKCDNKFFFLYTNPVLVGAVSKSTIVLGHQLILFVIIASNGV